MFFIKKCIKRKLKWFLTTKNLSFHTNSCNNQQVNLFRFFQNKYLTKVSVKENALHTGPWLYRITLRKPKTSPIMKLFLDFIAKSISKLTRKFNIIVFCYPTFLMWKHAKIIITKAIISWNLMWYEKIYKYFLFQLLKI